jgi:hypothetical protein
VLPSAGQDRAAQFDEIMTHVEQELGAAAGAYLMSVCLAALKKPTEALQVIQQTQRALDITVQQINTAQRLTDNREGEDEQAAPPAEPEAPESAPEDQPTAAAGLTRSNSTCSETTAETV